MITVKEITEDVSIVFKKIGALRAWTSVSVARVLFVVVLFGSVLVGGYYVYLESLFAEAKKAGENRTREIAARGKELKYKYTLDAIAACIESEKGKVPLNAWYCEKAISEYRNASIDWPQERVKAVIDKHAYIAMKNDVSHYLRSAEFDRLLNSPMPREEEILKLLLSQTVTTLWSLVMAVAVSGLYLSLRTLPKRKEDVSENLCGNDS